MHLSDPTLYVTFYFKKITAPKASRIWGLNGGIYK